MASGLCASARWNGGAAADGADSRTDKYTIQILSHVWNGHGVPIFRICRPASRDVECATKATSRDVRRGAIARAFEEAEQSEMEAKQARQREQEADAGKQNVEMGQDIVINECAERLMASEEGLVDQAPIGADTIHDPVTQDSKTYREQNSPDALARTAGELLGSVRHDHSAKFQNSQFLQLMRQLRDKEVKFEGDQIVGGGPGNGAADEVVDFIGEGRRKEVKVAS